jgi:replicative DNA helicase
LGANVELQLICKIVEIHDFHTVEKLKIDESFFLGDSNTISQTKEAFKFIRDHYHNDVTYGSVPSWDLLQQRFYGFPWTPSWDALPTLCQELRRMKLRSQILSLADEINQKADVDPTAALESVREASITLVSQHDLSNDMLLSAAGEQLYEDYQLVASGHGITGLPWPWDILNEDTQGIHKGNFIVLYGRPKSMKSWMALYIACTVYMANMRVLIYSLEMSQIQVLRRCASIISKVDYDKFKKGKLDPATQQRVFETLYTLRDEELSRTDGVHSSALMATSPKSESSGVATLQAKIREFDPDLVIVDGMYLMKDDRVKTRTIDWKSISHISQDLKRTASHMNVIGVTQANRGASKDPKQADLAELSYADALGQDCDLCMRIHKQKDTSSNENEIVLSFPGSREGILDNFVIYGIPATNFTFKRSTVTDPNNPQSGPPQCSGRGSTKLSAVLPTTWRNP